MRIQVDKTTGPPDHALSLADVKALLKVVPAEWNIRRLVVHLRSTLPENAHYRFERPVIYDFLGGELKVCCRGLDPETARKEILRELAIQGLRIRTRSRHRLSDAELKRIDQIVAPLLEQAREQAAQSRDSASAAPDSPANDR